MVTIELIRKAPLVLSGNGSDSFLELKPGMNTVEKQRWLNVIHHIGTIRYLDDKILVVHSEKSKSVLKTDSVIIPDIDEENEENEENEEDREFKSMSSLSVKDAIKVVRLSDNLDDLDQWNESETRKTILSAIRTRISQLKEG